MTNNVLALRTVPYAHHLIPPSSKHLANHRNSKRQNDLLAFLQSPILTLGGRVYLTDITLANHPFTVVIDTGSSDTWVASSSFECLDPESYGRIDTRYCVFNRTFDPQNSATWRGVEGWQFSVNYTGGEFLLGELGKEELGIGEEKNGRLTVNQTVGVVRSGYWVGDGISSGLMGLAYSALVSGAQELRYTSVMVTL